MAQPAVQGDVIKGQCQIGSHRVPNPNSGAAQPNPYPLPFAGRLEKGLVASVTIGGRPVAVVGSSAENKPPHGGLHPADKTQINTKLQVGTVESGSPTVTFGGEAAATSQSRCKICGGLATITTTIANVTVG
jgi:uncharacterized Zn-binding protein involved in type VI secretion